MQGQDVCFSTLKGWVWEAAVWLQRAPESPAHYLAKITRAQNLPERLNEHPASIRLTQHEKRTPVPRNKYCVIDICAYLFLSSLRKAHMTRRKSAFDKGDGEEAQQMQLPE